MAVNSLSSSHARSLYVGIRKRKADVNSPQRIGLAEEERHRRLVSLGEKVSRLAHDIRNPLSSIEWFATLLGREDHSQEERQELANHCIQAVRSLDHLVSNMLVFSAPINKDREPVNLYSIIDHVELLALYPLRTKRLTIHHQRKDGLHPIIIHGHESLLQQGLLNILMNAIQASPPDSAIEIYCQQTSRLVEQQGKKQSMQGVILKIRDFGCGMSDEELSHVFHPFYSNRKGGTGLGLSIVKQIVHIHHAMIDMNSQEGKGTTVELFFPQ